jgi:aminopeptidase
MRALLLVLTLCVTTLTATTLVRGRAEAHEWEGAVNQQARILVHYSLRLTRGDQLALITSPEADELNVAVYREALKAGAHVWVLTQLPNEDELLFRHGSDDQLAYVSPIMRLIAEKADAVLRVVARSNTHALAEVDSARKSRRARAMAPTFAAVMQRMGKHTLRYCETSFPTSAAAQEAGMGLLDYRDFVFEALQLHKPNPIAAWREMKEHQDRLTKRMAGKDQIVLKGKNIDLTLSIKGRRFLSGAGEVNFPDGEIFTSPVETSVEGWVRFSYPALFHGQEIEGAQLWLERGRVVRFTAAKGESALRALLDSDPGARVFGELGIGTNYGIKRFTRNMLFDEKIGGTIHLALGRSFPEAGGKNESSAHVDMLCDMADAEIRADGRVIYKNGRLVE